MKSSVVGLCAVLLSSGALCGQATSTASRQFDLQIGGGYTIVKSDYNQQVDYRGPAVYATLDFKPHFGAEIDFRQASSPVDKAYERTYEVGARYHREYGRFEPYIKVLYGRGVFNFVRDTYGANGPTSSVVVANLAYNEFAGGAGVDFHLLPYLNLRADYEYQMWHSFPPNGLTPQALTFGVAYHFPGGLAKGNRFR